MTENKKTKKRGVFLIEVAVGAAVISVILLALGAIATLSLNIAKISAERLQAVFLVSETIEAVKSMRDAGWTAKIAPLDSGAAYYLVFLNNAYQATTTQPNLIDGKFNRYFTVKDVCRDSGNDDIVVDADNDGDNCEEGGVNDLKTKLLTGTVEWSYRGTGKTVNMKTFITDLFSN